LRHEFAPLSLSLSPALLLVCLCQAYGPVRCGVIEASDVFDENGGVRCRNSCPQLPQPASISAGTAAEAVGAAAGRAAVGKPARTFGPLGVHFSHASLDVLRKRAMARGGAGLHADGIGAGGGGNSGRWLPSELSSALAELYSPYSTQSVHTVRGRLMAAFSSGYKKSCPSTITSDAKPYTTPAGIVEHFGMNCHEPCGGESGLCPSFCGPAGSCCRMGFHSGHVDPSCGLGTQGCKSFHCCVRAVRVD